MLDRQEITVVMATNLWCFREILRGIGAYATARATWKIRYFTPWDNYLDQIQRTNTVGVLFGNPMTVMPLSESDRGILERVGNVIGICDNLARVNIPVRGTVEVDNRHVGLAAAEHFLQKKHQHFAFIGYPDGFSVQRLNGFQEGLAAAGHQASTLFPNWNPVNTTRGWEFAYPNTELAPFLRSLPKPLALLTCADMRGREVIESCKEIGLRVPEDVAILGVDNDPLECQISYPALSSVSIPWEQIGYLAASQLDQLLHSQDVQPLVEIPPSGIMERNSTDNIAIPDADVATALLYIREHAHLPIGVDDIIRAVSMGRRTLEKRFKTILGRTLLDEIRRAHIARAKELLAQTDLTIAEVAERSGFHDASWFSTSFGQLVGVSPLQYRSEFK